MWQNVNIQSTSTAGRTYVFCCLVGAETCRIFYRRCLPPCHSIPRHFWDTRFSDRPLSERISDIATADTVLTNRGCSLAPWFRLRNRSITEIIVRWLLVSYTEKLESSFTSIFEDCETRYRLVLHNYYITDIFFYCFHITKICTCMYFVPLSFYYINL